VTQTINDILGDEVQETQNVTGQLMTKVTPESGLTSNIYASSRP